MNLIKKINYFLKGMGSVLEISHPKNELGDLFPHYSAKIPEEQDALALASDWNYIGKDLEYAISLNEEDK